jgi:hypothetical protein
MSPRLLILLSMIPVLVVVTPGMAYARSHSSSVPWMDLPDIARDYKHHGLVGAGAKELVRSFFPGGEDLVNFHKEHYAEEKYANDEFEGKHDNFETHAEHYQKSHPYPDSEDFEIHDSDSGSHGGSSDSGGSDSGGGSSGSNAIGGGSNDDGGYSGGSSDSSDSGGSNSGGGSSGSDSGNSGGDEGGDNN